MSCSLAVHITLVQQDVPFTISWAQRGPARKVGTPSFEAINPKRKVPTLVLPDGEVLTEITCVLATLAEGLGPEGAATRRRRIEWLSFLATELHQQVLGPAFDAATPAAAAEDARTRLLPPVLAHLEDTLARRETLLGGAAPEGADAYLFWGLLLLRHRWPEVVTPTLQAFSKRMLAHAFVSGPLAVEREAMASLA
jgi:glutathione S-transferase